MKLNTMFLALLGLFIESSGAERNDKILLSQVKTLTLRSGQVTASRRTAPVPQLKCVGGDGMGFYEIDVMRCTNMGSDYGDEDFSWSCTADVPKYFKLGSTDVLCEGYDGSEDKYILKGSCGVEYRLALTDAGYEKYGGSFSPPRKVTLITSDWWLWIFFWSVVVFIIYRAWTAPPENGGGTRRRPPGADNRRPWFGGGGGDDPPPPYDPYPPRFSKPTTPGTQGWQPGFWSGLATGGAAGSYLMSRRNRQDGYNRPGPGRPGYSSDGSSFAESSSAGAARHETTGFGQTRRR